MDSTDGLPLTVVQTSITGFEDVCNENMGKNVPKFQEGTSGKKETSKSFPITL